MKNGDLQGIGVGEPFALHNGFGYAEAGRDIDLKMLRGKGLFPVRLELGGDAIRCQRGADPCRGVRLDAVNVHGGARCGKELSLSQRHLLPRF